MPTQIITGEQGAATQPARSKPDTNSVGAPTPNEYQPAVPFVPRAAPIPYPSRSRSPIGWIFAFVGIGLVAVLFLAVLFAAKSARRNRIPLPPPPSGARALPGAGNATPPAGEIVETRLFSLEPDAKVSITNINGDMVIEGWDKPQAEVKVSRSGGDPRVATANYKADRDSLVIETALASSNARYEIKLPNQLKEVKIRTINSSVKLSKLNAAFDVETREGTIELLDVNGSATATTINGNIKASFEGVSDEGDGLKLSTVNGNISLRFISPLDADLDAETTFGNIEVDGGFGLEVEKRLAGFSQRVKGRLGDGGRPLTVKTRHGNIEIAK